MTAESWVWLCEVQQEEEKAHSSCSHGAGELHMGRGLCLTPAQLQRGHAVDMWIMLTCVLGCLWLQDPLHIGLSVDGQQTDLVCTVWVEMYEVQLMLMNESEREMLSCFML